MTRIARAASLAVCLTGCFGDLHPDPPDAARDALSDATSDRSDVVRDVTVDSADVSDATLDAAPEAALDVISDGALDVSFDAPADVVEAAADAASDDASVDADVGIDAREDASDAASDARADVSADARADVSVDVAADARADASADVSADVDPIDPTIEAPRLIEPLSVMRVLRRVRFGWANAPTADGAEIEVCRDRACAAVENTFTVTGDTLTTSVDIAPGYHFWRARGRRGRATGTASSTTWEFYVPPRRAGFTAPLPRQWGAMPDVNGDGRADLLAGAPASVATGGRTGAVYLFTGSTDRFSATPAVTPLVSSLGTGSYGRKVTPLGDVNGDGYCDVVVDAATSVGIHHGGASGPSTSPSRAYDVWRSATGAGDVNHDGYGDVLVWDGSRVGLILGGAGGTASAPVRMLGGTSAVAVGDINSDGYDDIAVQTATTRLGVFLGNLAGFDATATYTLDAPAGYLFNSPSLAGDVNGDGVADVVATATVILGTASLPVVFLLVPPATRTLSATLLNAPSPRPASFGSAVAGAGDFNGDGIDDLIAGSGGATSNEAMCVYAGSATGPAVAPTQCIPSTSATHFGISVGGVGDLNADGFEEVVVGASGSSAVRGSVVLYRGRAAGVVDPLIAPYSAGETAGGFGTDVGGWR